RLDEVGAAELLRLLIAFLAKSGYCEVTLRNCSRQPSAVVGELVVTDCVREVEIIPVAVIVATTCRVSNGWIGSRAPCLITQRARLAYRHETVVIHRRDWITRLHDAGAAETPATSEPADCSGTIVKSLQ